MLQNTFLKKHYLNTPTNLTTMTRKKYAKKGYLTCI